VITTFKKKGGEEEGFKNVFLIVLFFQNKREYLQVSIFYILYGKYQLENVSLKSLFIFLNWKQ